MLCQTNYTRSSVNPRFHLKCVFNHAAREECGRGNCDNYVNAKAWCVLSSSIGVFLFL